MDILRRIVVDNLERKGKKMALTKSDIFLKQTEKAPTSSDFYELLLDNQSMSFTPEELVKTTKERFNYKLTEKEAKSIIEGFVHRGFVCRAYRRYRLARQDF